MASLGLGMLALGSAQNRSSVRGSGVKRWGIRLGELTSGYSKLRGEGGWTGECSLNGGAMSDGG